MTRLLSARGHSGVLRARRRLVEAQGLLIEGNGAFKTSLAVVEHGQVIRLLAVSECSVPSRQTFAQRHGPYEQYLGGVSVRALVIREHDQVIQHPGRIFVAGSVKLFIQRQGAAQLPFSLGSMPLVPVLQCLLVQNLVLPCASRSSLASSCASAPAESANLAQGVCLLHYPHGPGADVRC